MVLPKPGAGVSGRIDDVNPSTAQARTIIEELTRCGVTDIVLAPGSRSAPLAIAAAEAEAAGAIVLHVRIDERSAGYLALGIAQVTGIPAAVITTSGTAAVNLHPAMVEAHHLGTPMLALTADRPLRLQDVGANQTVDQLTLFSHARAVVQMPQATAEPGAVAVWRSITARAVATATDVFNPGPVQINIPFDTPLVPDGDESWIESLAGRPDERPWHADARMVGGMSSPFDEVLAGLFDDTSIPSRGVVVIGQHRDPDFTDMADELAAAMGWPIIAEPSGNAASADTAISHGALILADPAFADAHIPDLVVTIGTIGLHRSVSAMIKRAGLHIAVDGRPEFADPTRTADVILAAVPMPPTEIDVDPTWLTSWQRADLMADAAIATALEAEADVFSGMHVARVVAESVPEEGLLFLGSSWPVRHVSAFALSETADATVIGNRGTSGIDGCISSAWGAAHAWQRQGFGSAVALIGDITFLYDTNGLVVPEDEPQPALVIVVVDNDGGGIFSALEQGAPQFEPIFERVFGTPMHKDVAALAQAYGYPAQVATSVATLTAAIDKAMAADGVQIVIARTCARQREARLLADVDRAIATALDSA
jgi:2-succinyl-5-enolpyruvyl-6-hydroxy-3-cyclohexene-1-carboxylate synthase